MKEEPWYPFVTDGSVSIQQKPSTVPPPPTTRLPTEFVKPLNKHVTFSEVDDVTYIYQWSPTKHLLFGKHTDEELRRRRENANLGELALTSILKKTIYDTVDDDEHTNIALREDTRAMSDRKSLPSIDASTQLLEEEIIVEENFPKHPVLPSMAIFSPDENMKDLTSNGPIKKVCKTVKKKRKKVKKQQQQLSSNFTLIGDGVSIRNEVLPQLASPPASGKLNEASKFGKIKNLDERLSPLKTTLSNRYFKMPSIGIGMGESVRSKPLIKTQITQRYSLDSDDLDDIQGLTEETFYVENIQDGNSIGKRMRCPLPHISDAYFGNSSTVKRNRLFFSSLDQSKTKSARPSQRDVCDTTSSQASGKKLLLRSCKQEVYMVDKARFPDTNSSSILSSIKK